MTRLLLNTDASGDKRIELITEDNEVHGCIKHAGGVAEFNIGEMDIDALPPIEGIVLWTDPQSSHPTPDAWDTEQEEFIGPVNNIPVGHHAFQQLGDRIMPVDPRYHEGRGTEIESVVDQR